MLKEENSIMRAKLEGKNQMMQANLSLPPEALHMLMK